jgi:hypothetical protein
MLVVQECRELFAQRFIALGVVTRDHRSLKQCFLDVARQLASGADDGVPEGNRKPLSFHAVSMPEPGCGSDLQRDRRVPGRSPAFQIGA